jgi:hypothetical protein
MRVLPRLDASKKGGPKAALEDAADKEIRS